MTTKKRRVDPDKVAKALGAEKMSSEESKAFRHRMKGAKTRTDLVIDVLNEIVKMPPKPVKDKKKLDYENVKSLLKKIENKGLEFDMKMQFEGDEVECIRKALHHLIDYWHFKNALYDLLEGEPFDVYEGLEKEDMGE
jgi:hypothetical protein